MPQIQYPFIDIAVHPAVRGKFAAGEAIAIFSREMTQVLWANGEGAKLFGYDSIYDFLDNGPDRAGVAFRQLAATARQLETVGDRRSLMMRVSTGFVSQAVAAEVTLVEVRRDETVVIFSAPVAANSTPKARIASMLKGFDDPDTHMAVIDDHGTVLAASPGFEALGILPETARTLIAAVVRTSEGLIKRPVASGAGYLPAAIGRLSIDPPLNLLFCVETVLGRMDAPHETVAEPRAAEDSVEQDVSLPGAGEPAPATSAESATPDSAHETEAARPSQEAESPAAAPAPFMDLAERAWQPHPAVATAATASEPTYTAAAGLPDAEKAVASAVTAEPDLVGEAPQHLELAADQAEATANPDERDAAAETPPEATDEVAASDDQPVDDSRSEDGLPAGTTAENMELAADQAEATVNPDQDEPPAEAETPSAAMDETAASNDRPADDSRSEDQGLDEQVPSGSLELAADQADTASMPEIVPETESAPETLPQNLELASDEAEAQSPAAMNGAGEPEELLEADRAEAALNEGHRRPRRSRRHICRRL